jgi:hypothetical protein
MKDRTKSCKTCAFFTPSRPGARDGACRAHAPLPILVGMAQQPSMSGLIGGANGPAMATPVVQGYFPPVHESVWCGDWRTSTGAAMEIEETAA